MLEARLALKLSRLQRHRGPYWSGVFSDDDAVLVHERLAIVDVETGAQPIRGCCWEMKGITMSELEPSILRARSLEALKAKAGRRVMFFDAQGRLRSMQHLVRRSKTLVELKGGGSRNLFLVHDGDGQTPLYLNLAHRMPDHLSVVGIEPHRIPGVPLSHLSIEEMATFYVGEIRHIQPNGPYLLGGLCAGGVIAFEMASQLVRAGESVELVALLEAAAPRAPKRQGLVSGHRLGRLTQALADASRTDRSYVERVWTILGVISRKLVNMLTWEIVQRGRRWSVGARFRLLR